MMMVEFPPSRPSIPLAEARSRSKARSAGRGARRAGSAGGSAGVGVGFGGTGVVMIWADSGCVLQVLYYILYPHIYIYIIYI